MITDPEQLIDMLALHHTWISKAHTIVKHFPLRVTHSFVARMKKGDPYDPLLQQVLPLAMENEITPGFSQDPLSESQHNPIPGLLHKYKSRVLITVTGGCAIHCRYCFRRHFPYQENTPGQHLDPILQYIAKDPTIREVILSGGDPLIVSDHYLSSLIKRLETIPHLQILRIHSRLPIVLPERMTSSLLDCLTQTRLKPILVIHTNHPNEIDEHVKSRLQLFSTKGIFLLNQTVLLKHINDTVDTLEALSYRLFSCQVSPYYLHCLDKVQGTAHFEVDIHTAKQLYHQLRARLSGYLVPLLVREEAGAPSKSPML